MTIDDSSPAQCRQEDMRLARIEEEHSLVASDPDEIADAEFECEINAQYLAMRSHYQTCQWLGVDNDRVTLHDLTKAAMTVDPALQFSRLRQLFEACGVLPQDLQTEREDLIWTIADYGPQSDRERTILFQQKTAERMAASNAREAMAPGVLPQVAGLHANNFGKLVRISNELGDRLDGMRGRSRPSAREVAMGVALFATARSPIAPKQHEAARLPRRTSVTPAIGHSSEHLEENVGASARPPGWDLL